MPSRLRLLLPLLLLAMAAVPRPVAAQVGSARYSSIVVDEESGNVLSAVNPDELRFPASLTKMMTLYLLFEALRDRRLQLTDTVPVSPSASSMPPTKLGLVPGSIITVEQAIMGLVTKSANDAAAALGEMLGGDEERFAQMMTLRARSLGMTRTVFRNASGLPDWGQVSTARDMAILARHLIQDFPGFYHYFSTPSFTYAGRHIYTHQRLLQTYPGADGLKTGYIEASGYNVVTSALRNNVRLIGVVFGGGSGWERDTNMAQLLDQGFERMGVPAVYARREAPARTALIGTAHAAEPAWRGAAARRPAGRSQARAVAAARAPTHPAVVRRAAAAPRADRATSRPGALVRPVMAPLRKTPACTRTGPRCRS